MVPQVDRPSGELRLEMKRVFGAPAAVVFGAFTDAAQLSTWWGPEGFTLPSLTYQPRTGARYRIQMQPPAGDPFSLTGRFREFTPPARLVFTFVWEPPHPDDVETVVSLSFRDVGGATELTLEQGPFKTEARRALHRDGWTDSFHKLERLIPAAGT